MKNIDNFRELDQEQATNQRPVVNLDKDRVNPDINSVPIDQTSEVVTETDKRDWPPFPHMLECSYEQINMWGFLYDWKNSTTI